MMLLKNKNDVDMFINAVDKCSGEVYVCSMDKTEEFNLKSLFSRYIAIGELCKEHGDEYEVFCANHDDEAVMIEFFYDLRKEDRKNKRCA
ncbi:MAG: hypothetical protein II640_01445 [Lachnospiraceae bacterium]|nr:hypothetical protein [Lachnospiraceae bacterium]